MHGGRENEFARVDMIVESVLHRHQVVGLIFKGGDDGGDRDGHLDILSRRVVVGVFPEGERDIAHQSGGEGGVVGEVDVDSGDCAVGFGCHLVGVEAAMLVEPSARRDGDCGVAVGVLRGAVGAEVFALGNQ